MQGFNMGRYVPPDQEGVKTGNQLAGKRHALGSRARHLHTTGALVVRFEMPFAIWCTSCKPHETLIGQGVRFNAEKKTIGSYYSTPIYSFRMKHSVCAGWIEIRTDPKSTSYVVVQGARKRDTGVGDSTDLLSSAGQAEIRIKLPGELDASRDLADPFAKLEGKVADKKRAETASGRIVELQKRQLRDWDDPYEQSKRLRKAFRAERKLLERAEANREALKDKMSLDIDVVDETVEDQLRAHMVDFGPDLGAAPHMTRLRPMFESPQSARNTTNISRRNSKIVKKRGRVLPIGDITAQRKKALQDELKGNTRAAVDPFLNIDEKAWQPSVKKRKASPSFHSNISVSIRPNGQTTALEDDKASRGIVEEPGGEQGRGTGLVDYTSDSE